MGERLIRVTIAEQSMEMHFQPIFDLKSGGVMGVEALARFAPHPIRPPDEWFLEAASVGRGVGLEIAALNLALEQLDRLPAGMYLSLNAAADTIQSEEFRATLNDVPAERIVLELTEHAPVDDYRGLETAIDLENLRQVWRAASPMVYFDKFSRWPRRSLIIYAKYDMTFLPEFSKQVVTEFEKHNLDHKVVVLPCGHYTMGETPYKYMDGWQLASFLRTAFD